VSYQENRPQFKPMMGGSPMWIREQLILLLAGCALSMKLSSITSCDKPLFYNFLSVIMNVSNIQYIDVQII